MGRLLGFLVPWSTLNAQLQRSRVEVQVQKSTVNAVVLSTHARQNQASLDRSQCSVYQPRARRGKPGKLWTVGITFVLCFSPTATSMVSCHFFFHFLSKGFISNVCGFGYGTTTRNRTSGSLNYPNVEILD